MPLCWLGWENVYENWILRGSAFLLTCLVVGSSGGCLLILTHFRSTWDWWL